MFDWLNDFFGWLIRFFCELCGNNFVVGIFVFTLVVNAVLIPLNIKQQKSTASQARMKNKLAKLQEKYKNDKAKYQEEMGKLYSEAGSSPLSGCLLMFIRFPIFICIYTAVREALSYVYGADAKLIEAAEKVLKSDVLGKNLLSSSTPQLSILEHMDKLVEHDGKFAALTGDLNLDFNLLGINLLETPSLGKVFTLISIIPLLSFLTSFASSLISMANTKKTNGDSNAATNGCMMIMMPLFSLWITFSVPGAVGWYWVCSNIVSTIIMTAMQKIYFPGKLIAEAEAKEAKKRRKLEQQRINPALNEKSILK